MWIDYCNVFMHSNIPDITANTGLKNARYIMCYGLSKEVNCFHKETKYA